MNNYILIFFKKCFLRFSQARYSRYSRYWQIERCRDWKKICRIRYVKIIFLTTALWKGTCGEDIQGIIVWITGRRIRVIRLILSTRFRNPYVALADIYNLRTRFILMTTRNHRSPRHARLRILRNKVVDIVEYERLTERSSSAPLKARVSQGWLFFITLCFTF